MLCKLIDLALVVLMFLMFKFFKLLASQDSNFPTFPVLKGLKKLKKLKAIKNPLACKSIIFQVVSLKFEYFVDFSLFEPFSSLYFAVWVITPTYL